jgi:hypothetical protein
VQVGAYSSYGKRQLSWSIDQPGEIARNQFAYAWFDVTEREPWKGEPLWLSATRRMPTDTTARTSFTDKGREAVAALVLPVIARYGFTRAWIDAHGQRGNPAADRDAADEARRHAAWWTQKAELAEWHAEGLLSFRPVDPDPKSYASRYPTVKVVPRWHGGSPWEEVTAEALMDGERVGWITKDAQLVPDQSILTEGAT